VNWIVIGPIVALTLAIFATSAALGSRRGYRHGMQAFEAEYKALNVEHGVAVVKADGLEQDLERVQRLCKIAQEQREKLNRENDALHKHFEIMKEALNVAQAEVARLQKSADHATIPLAEAVKPEPKRTRKKAGTS
jgi:chromosome segregation ATPase